MNWNLLLSFVRNYQSATEAFFLESTFSKILEAKVHPGSLDLIDQKILIYEAIRRNDLFIFQILLKKLPLRAFENVVEFSAVLKNAEFLMVAIGCLGSEFVWRENDLAHLCLLQDKRLLHMYFEAFHGCQIETSSHILPHLTEMPKELVEWIMERASLEYDVVLRKMLQEKRLDFLKEASTLALLKELGSLEPITVENVEQFNWLVGHGFEINGLASFSNSLAKKHYSLSKCLIAHSRRNACIFLPVCLRRWQVDALGLFPKEVIRFCLCKRCISSRKIIKTIYKIASFPVIGSICDMDGDLVKDYCRLLILGEEQSEGFDWEFLLEADLNYKIYLELEAAFGRIEFHEPPDLMNFSDPKSFEFLIEKFYEQNLHFGPAKHEFLHLCIQKGNLDMVDRCLSSVSPDSIEICCFKQTNEMDVLQSLFMRKRSLSFSELYGLGSVQHAVFAFKQAKLQPTKQDWLRIFCHPNWKKCYEALQPSQTPHIIDDLLQMKNLFRYPSLAAIKFVVEIKHQRPAEQSIEAACRKFPSNVCSFLMKFGSNGCNTKMREMMLERGFYSCIPIGE